MKKITEKVGIKYQAKCHYCNTEFEYQEGDVFPFFDYRYVNCPVCHGLIPHSNTNPKISTMHG